VTKVDFYILQGGQSGNPLPFICRLVQKVHAQGMRIYLHARDAAQASRLDEILWAYSQESFIPHTLYTEGGGADPDTPIRIGTGVPPPDQHDVLINLADQVPDWFSRFTRVAEVAAGDGEQLQLARHRYRFYKERGYPLTDHKIE